MTDNSKRHFSMGILSRDQLSVILSIYGTGFGATNPATSTNKLLTQAELLPNNTPPLMPVTKNVSGFPATENQRSFTTDVVPHHNAA